MPDLSDKLSAQSSTSKGLAVATLEQLLARYGGIQLVMLSGMSREAWLWIDGHGLKARFQLVESKPREGGR
jgi:hypothetical protein